jgi:hypothetical protein
VQHQRNNRQNHQLPPNEKNPTPLKIEHLKEEVKLKRNIKRTGQSNQQGPIKVI